MHLQGTRRKESLISNCCIQPTEAEQEALQPNPSYFDCIVQAKERLDSLISKPLSKFSLKQINLTILEAESSYIIYCNSVQNPLGIEVTDNKNNNGSISNGEEWNLFSQ
jgi:transcription termination factor NusB